MVQYSLQWASRRNVYKQVLPRNYQWSDSSCIVLAPPDSLNIHAMFLDGELQYRKSPQTVPVQFNPEAMTLTGGQEY